MNALIQALCLHYDACLTGAFEENPLYYAYAPQGVAAPYVVANLITQDHTNAMGAYGTAGGSYEEYVVQFTVIDAERAGLADLLTGYAALCWAYDEADIPLTGASCIRMRRLTTVGPMPDPDAMDGGWMLTVDYLIETDTEII